MKQMVCEMCGGTDLIKEDGVFVCKSCGCKYSVEEARKMMIDGTVEVTGTVKVDNTAQIENIRKMADDAFIAGNYEEAGASYNRLLELLPNDPMALLYKGICMLRTSKLADVKSSECIRYGVLALQAYYNGEYSTDDIVKFRLKMAGEYNQCGVMVYGSAMQFINENWKYQNAHSTFWGIMFSAVELFEAAVSALDDDDCLILNDEVVKNFKTYCKNVADSVDELTKKRKYVESITSGTWISTENKASIWLNDSTAANYKKKKNAALEARDKVEERVKKKKNDVALKKLKENPEECNKRLDEIKSRIEYLQSELKHAEKDISDAETQKLAQEDIMNNNKFKFFGDGAKAKKDAKEKISRLSSRISENKGKKEKCSQEIRELQKEFEILKS